MSPKKCPFHGCAEMSILQRIRRIPRLYPFHLWAPYGSRQSSNDLDWPKPRKVKDVQSFLGFCNFYQCFIHGYLDIVVPLTRLTQKSAAWHFTDTCCASFELLKEQFTRAPVLTKWVPDSEMIVETDTSDYVLAAIISCRLPDGKIHPIAFHSHSFNSAELNYDTHDKELLAIFEAFKHWQQYLEGSRSLIDVVLCSVPFLGLRFFPEI